MAVQRYRVLERIAVGGMAEVYKGVATSLRGFEKIVAIKRVLPHLTRNRTFVRMFLDEARLSLYLNHANVAQVFDVGHSDDAYFIVMEYVEGIDLLDLMDVTSHNDLLLPYEQAVFIASQLCQGLAYAHDKRDPSGEPLGIVHRDISPPNVLLSMQGEVKIVDFGLAKARSQIETTDPGLVKGKFGYLSPEAAYGDSIDARTDIFAVGIVLWEMLAGRRLFSGEHDQDTLELVRRAKVPDLGPFNPEVPEALEAIVRKALARDKDMRYQRAADLGRALSQFLFGSGREVTSYDIAALVQAAAQLTDRGGLGPMEGSQASGLDAELDVFIEDELSLISFSSDADDAATAAPGVSPLEAAAPGRGRLGFGALGGDDDDAPGGSLEDPSDWFESPLFDGSIDMSLVQIVGAAAGGDTSSPPEPSADDGIEVDLDLDDDADEALEIDVDFDGDGAADALEIDVDFDAAGARSEAEASSVAATPASEASETPSPPTPRTPATPSPPELRSEGGAGGRTPDTRARLWLGVGVLFAAAAVAALLFLLN